MNEKDQYVQTEDFPDEKSPEHAGCYEYAFYKLGLDPKEANIGLAKTQLRKYFVKVDENEAPNALVIRKKNSGWIVHMVFIDQQHGGIFKQRGNVGWPIEQVSLDGLNNIYDSNRYEYVYLKKKPKETNFLRRVLNRRKS